MKGQPVEAGFPVGPEREKRVSEAFATGMGLAQDQLVPVRFIHGLPTHLSPKRESNTCL